MPLLGIPPALDTMLYCFILTFILILAPSDAQPGVPPRHSPPKDPHVPPPNEPVAKQQEYPSFDLELGGPLPGVQHEFKIEIPAGRSECFYQKLKKGASLHLSFEVVRGADRNVDVIIRQPDGEILDKHLWTRDGATDTEAPLIGDYAFCVDNSFSRFSSKLVYLFIITYVRRDWEDFAQNQYEFESSAGNITVEVDTISKQVLDMKRHLAASRQHAVTDWYLIRANNQHIRDWSLLMSAVIVLTSCSQVYFVRRLFSQPASSPARPRA